MFSASGFSVGFSGFRVSGFSEKSGIGFSGFFKKSGKTRFFGFRVNPIPNPRVRRRKSKIQ